LDKTLYLKTLRVALNKLNENAVDKNTVEDIIADYSMHFDEAIAEGITVDETISRLGSPELVAQKYRQCNGKASTEASTEAPTDAPTEAPTEAPIIKVPKDAINTTHEPSTENSKVSYKQQHTKVKRTPLASLIVFCGLAFLNLTFVLGPFIAVWATWFAFIVAGAALLIESARMIIFASMDAYIASGISDITLFAQIGFYLTFGLFIVFIMLQAGKGLSYITKKYINWNMALVKGE
jgi:uncharacterized membrane protein